MRVCIPFSVFRRNLKMFILSIFSPRAKISEFTIGNAFLTRPKCIGGDHYLQKQRKRCRPPSGLLDLGPQDGLVAYKSFVFPFVALSPNVLTKYFRL